MFLYFPERIKYNLKFRKQNTNKLQTNQTNFLKTRSGKNYTYIYLKIPENIKTSKKHSGKTFKQNIFK